MVKGRKTTVTAVALEAIGLGVIDPSPFQPRTEFPKEEIDGLAESMTAAGQIQPIVVRRKGKRYELIEGERRLRAAKVAGWPAIRAEVHEADDATVRLMIFDSQSQRKALNPIDEARSMRTMIDEGDAAGPTELAGRLGCSQGHVSNRLRLLELPAAWHKRIISGEIPPTHARVIAKYKDSPTALKQIAKELDLRKKAGDTLGTVKTFAEDVGWAIRDSCKAIGGGQCYNRELGRHVTRFKPNDDQLAKLDVVEDHEGQKFAANVTLWEKLQAEHVKQLGKNGESKKGKTPTKPKEKKKVSAAEARRIEKERAAAFRGKLWAWYVNWLRYLIAATIENTDHCGEDERRALLLWAAVTLGDSLDRERTLDVAWRKLGKRAKKRPGFGIDVAGIVTAEQSPAMTEEMEIAVLRGIFWNDDEPGLALEHDVLTIAEFLELDHRTIEPWWGDEQAGPLTDAYWAMHDKARLTAIAEEYELEIKASAAKADLIERLSSERAVFDRLPGELATIKRPK